MITVGSDALIDLIVDADGNVTSVVGGGALNTARSIARLGQPVSFLGGVSVDSFGRRIRRLLDADGVRYALADSVSAPTTLAIAELDATGAATYRFMLVGTSVDAMTEQMALAHVPADTSILHVGTLGLMLEPTASALRSVVEAAPDDRLVMVDPNCRPSVLSDDTVFRRTLAAVFPRADVIKVSGDDVAFLYPGMPAVDGAAELQRLSGALVLLTDGAASVHVLTASDHITVDVPPVPVADTVGAGDSFSGGFLAHWAMRDLTITHLQDLPTVLDAVRFGIEVAGITCQRPGADPPFLHEL